MNAADAGVAERVLCVPCDLCVESISGVLELPDTFIEAVNKALYAVAHVPDMEVEQQADTLVTAFHVGKQLRRMDRLDAADCLHFDNHFLLHEEVEAKADLEPDPVE